jgi:hypothetical protein
LFAKLQQVLWGVALGLVCAFAFTIAQNKFNTNRNKVKSWLFAVVVWMVMKLAAMFAMGAL